MAQQFKTIEFSNDEKLFLKGYAPKDRHFTSLEEISLVEKNLHLDKYTEPGSLRAVRNSVVMFYDGLMDAEEDRNVIYEFMTSMMSVTAVIDNFCYKN